MDYDGITQQTIEDWVSEIADVMEASGIDHTGEVNANNPTLNIITHSGSIITDNYELVVEAEIESPVDDPIDATLTVSSELVIDGEYMEFMGRNPQMAFDAIDRAATQNAVVVDTSTTTDDGEIGIESSTVQFYMEDDGDVKHNAEDSIYRIANFVEALVWNFENLLDEE